MTEEQLPHKSNTLREDGRHCDSVECWCWEDRYMVVTRETIKDLTEVVNAFIHQKGWKPIGGMTATSEVWAQAMVRHL